MKRLDRTDILVIINFLLLVALAIMTLINEIRIRNLIG